jgi:hypothetical protein
MTDRARVGFGLGNLATATLLIVGVFMLPVRYWLVDALLVLGAIATAVSAVALLANVRWAARSLRISALTLLGVGLIAVLLAVLTLSFLAGVHGRWLEAGIPVTYSALALIVPYTIVYPIAQLLAIGDETGASA